MAADLNPDLDPGLDRGSERGPASRPGRRRVVRDAVVLIVVLAGLALLVLRPGGDEPEGAGRDRGCQPQPGVLLGAGKSFPVSCTVERFEGGTTVRFADLQAGKPLVVNFWASWCSACLKEMPGYQQVYAAGSGRFELVGVDVLGTLQTIAGDTATAGRDFARQMGVHYPLVFDEDWLLYRHFNSQPTLPTTLFVRPDGVVAHMRIGPYAPEELAAGIRRYLGINVTVAGAEGPPQDRSGIRAPLHPRARQRPAPRSGRDGQRCSYYSSVAYLQVGALLTPCARGAGALSVRAPYPAAAPGS